MAVLSSVPGILYLTQPRAMTRDRQCLCRRPQKLWSESSIAKWENPLFREFHEALCRYNLIPTSFLKNDVLLFSGNLGRFSLFERGHDIMVRPFIALQPPTPLLPLFNDIFAGAWWAGAAPAQPKNSCAARALHLRPIFNCPVRPSGPTGGPCTPGLAPVGHRYPWK